MAVNWQRNVFVSLLSKRNMKLDKAKAYLTRQEVNGSSLVEISTQCISLFLEG